MTRVVKPDGIVASYMWDLHNGGVPVAPVYRTMQSLGIAVSLPGVEVSRSEGMQALWLEAGLQSVETCVIRIPVAYASFDDFWQSYKVPLGDNVRSVARLLRSFSWIRLDSLRAVL